MIKEQHSLGLSSTATSETLGRADQRSDKLEVLDLLIFFAKHKRIIFITPLVVAALAAAISLLMPNVYMATVKLLPPQQAQSSAAALLSQLGGVVGVGTGGGGLKNPNDMYIGMLQSRTVADRLIARFDLRKVYNVDLQEQARETLARSTEIVAGKDGLITIQVENKDQKLVARLANAYVDELLTLTKTLALSEASQRRVFFEHQLEQSKTNLSAAELALKRALETKGVVSVDTESRAMLETIGRLRAQISAKEIQRNSLTAFVTAENSDFKRVEEELKSLRRELASLQGGRSAGGADTSQSNGGLENIKILRDVKYNQMLYELLAKQYEVARLDEAKDPSIIQVLDPALEPERKFKPKRALIVLVSTIAAFILSVIWAIVRETKHRLSIQPDGAAQLAQLRNYLWMRTK